VATSPHPNDQGDLIANTLHLAFERGNVRYHRVVAGTGPKNHPGHGLNVPIRLTLMISDR